MTNRLAKIAVMGLAVVLLGGSQAQAQVTKNGSGYKFRIKFTKGKTVKLKINATVPYPGQPKPITISSMVAHTVAGVAGNVATINGKVGPTLMNGNPMMEKPMTSTVKMDSLGKVVGQPSGSSSFITFPANPVKVGGTWDAKVPLAGLGGSAAATFKFLGMKSVNGKQVADLAVSINTTGPQKATGTGRMLVLAADGMPLKMDLKLNLASTENGGKPIVAPISILRV